MKLLAKTNSQQELFEQQLKQFKTAVNRMNYAEKKKKNSEYYELKSSMQELLKAQKNVEMFLAAEQNQAEKEKQKEQNR